MAEDRFDDAESAAVNVTAEDRIDLLFHPLDGAGFGLGQSLQRDVDLPGALLRLVPQTLVAFGAARADILVAHELHEQTISDSGPSAL